MTVWQLVFRVPVSPGVLPFETATVLALPDKPSIAVLSCDNMSRDPEQEYFSDGMIEDLITDLSKLSGLVVIVRNSVFTYKGKAVRPEQVSRELGVRYVLEGSVRKAGDRVRITAQLVEATTGYPRWADAQFAGIWSGEAVDERGSICNTLVVEEVLANGYARVIFSMGTSAALHVRLPRFLRATGRVVDGELRVQLPLSPPRLTYRLAGETLQGTHEGGDWRPGSATLTRLADVTQVGCGPPAAGPLPSPAASGPRDRLTAAELLAPDAGHRPPVMGRDHRHVILGPVHNAYFMPMGQAAPARHAFQGTVSVAFSHMFRAWHGCTALGATMPGFMVAFFTQGEHLVPVVRDILQPPETPNHGTLILSPGRVWSEPGDGGLSRASFPFVLIERPATRNGLATFLYDDTQVSALRLQIVQENVPWGVAKYDGWGQASMTYTPGGITDEEALRARFAAELQQQTPSRPWAALPASVGALGLEHFDGDTVPADLKASGSPIIPSRTKTRRR